MNRKVRSFLKNCFILIFVCLSLLLLYRNVLIFMVRQWSTLDMYSHGFIIPLVSFYLILVKRKELSAMHPSPSYVLGYVILICGLLMFLFGEVGSIIVLQSLSILPAIAGIIIVVLGFSFMKLLIIPVGYLIFMVPVWEMVTYNLHPPFQYFSAVMGGMILKLLEIPIHVQGNVLQLPNITFRVARECSGVNYLISILAIGIPLAWLFLDSMKKRFVLILFAIIIAICANGVRVALIGVLGYKGIARDLHGPFHVMQGVSVSLIGYVVLSVGLWILRRRRSETLKAEHKKLTPNVLRENSSTARIFWPAISVVFLLIAVESYSHFRTPTPIPLKANLDLLPAQIDGWEAGDTVSSFIPYQYPGVDVELKRTYRKASDTIDLYIGYFKYQEQGKELIYHKTRELHAQASKIRVPTNPHSNFEVNMTVTQNSGYRSLVLFWYDMNGYVVTERYVGKLYTIWDALVRGRTNGAVIMLTTELYPNEDPLSKLNMMQTFAGKTYPLLKNFLPGK